MLCSTRAGLRHNTDLREDEEPHLVVETISRPAATHEAAEGVAAATVITEPRHGSTLIDILQYDGLLIRLEAWPARADDLVVSRARDRTWLTLRAPGLT